jgi:hypothetical protein
MRHLAANLVLTLLGAAAGAAEDAAAIDASVFTVGVTQLQMERSISFANNDLKRATGNESSALYLNLGHGNVEVVDIAAVSCDSALTDAGEELAGAPQTVDSARMMNRSYERMLRKAGMAAPGMTIHLALRYPAKPAKTLSKVTGTIDVVCEAAPGETISLSPASDWVGKKRDLPGSAAGFTLLALDPIKYTCDKAVIDGVVVKSLDFLDPQGKEMPDSGWSGSGGNDGTTTVTRHGGKLPPTGAVRLTLTGKTTTVHVPIALADIPLQAPPLEAAPAPAKPAAPPEKPGKKTSDF